jgi:hypothetical protein
MPLVAADEQPNVYPVEEQPSLPGETPPCTPIFIFIGPPYVLIDYGCIDEIVDDLFPVS